MHVKMGGGCPWKLGVSTAPKEKKIFGVATSDPSSTECVTFLLTRNSPESYANQCNQLTAETIPPRKHETFHNGVARVTYADLQVGLYCLFIYPCKKVPNLVPCFQRANLTSAEPDTSVTLPPKGGNDDSGDNIEKVLFGVLGAVLAAIFIVFFIYLRFSRKTAATDHLLLPNKATDDSISGPSVQKVFLVYSHDFDLHVDAVKTFAEVLEKCFKCEVSFDEKELHNIMTNEQGWIHQIKHRKKIIIISSEGAFLQQQAWLHDKVAVANKSMDMDYFLPVLSQLTFGQRFNYRDVINIRFSYTDRRFLVCDVVSQAHYGIPQDFEHMINVVFDGMQPPFNQEDEPFRRLLDATEKCKIFLENNPNYIQSSLVPYDSIMTTIINDRDQRPLQLQLSVDSGHHSSQSSPDTDVSGEYTSLEMLLKKNMTS